jgi:Flp pilus assembly protein TadG
MRRMTEPTTDDVGEDDRGVASIVVILAMATILVGAAFAIDVGRYVFEARSAQNSADATALAVATDCALGGAPIADYSPYRKDGQTISKPTCHDGAATITVTTSVNQTFLQQSAGEVDRSATARWGTLGGATTIPITIAKCELPKAPPGTSTEIIIHLPDTKTQTGCSSGPGGFGQLRKDEACKVTVTAEYTLPGDGGNDWVNVIPCVPTLPADLLIPVFDDEKCPPKGCQANDQYPIAGFAAFHLTGYSFFPRSGGDVPDCDKAIGKNCIKGYFTNMVTSQGTQGPSEEFGVSVIYLSD